MSIRSFDLDFSGRPVIDLFVSPNPVWHEAANDPDATPIRLRVRALVDSGANRGILDRSVVEELNIDPSGRTKIATVSSGRDPIFRSTYLISLFRQNVAGECISPNLEIAEVSDLLSLISRCYWAGISRKSAGYSTMARRGG